MEKRFCAKIEGGEEIRVTLELDGNVVKKHEWTVIGGLRLLTAAKNLQQNFPKTIDALILPEGNDASTLLLKELVQKIKGTWTGGDGDEEICHCRKISQSSIDRAIILGAHTLEKVRKRTSANTGCGACMPDVQDLITKRVS